MDIINLINTIMIRKGTNAVQIFDDMNGTGQTNRRIWWGDLNNSQLKKILTWTLNKGYTVITSPCGGKMIDINLEEIKIKCLKYSIYFYEQGETTLTIERYNNFKKELYILEYIYKYVKRSKKELKS